MRLNFRKRIYIYILLSICIYWLREDICLNVINFVITTYIHKGTLLTA